MGLKSIEGLPIVDATADAIIEVIKRDTTAEAKRQNPGECVIARACKRDFVTEDARVHRSRVYVKRGKKWVRYVASGPIRFEVLAFDRGGEFQTGEYKLIAPAESQRLGVVRGTGGGASKKASGKRRHVFANVRGRPTTE